MMEPRTLRFRMTFLFCAVVGVLLTASYLGFAVLLAREVRGQLDRQLLATARPVVADLMTDPSEQDVNELNVPDEYFELLDASGRVLQLSKNLRGRPLELEGASLQASVLGFRNIRASNGSALRLALVPFERGKETLILAVAAPNRDAEEALASFERIIALLLPLSLLVTAAISGWYVSKSLAPVSALTRHAELMSARVSRADRQELWTPLAVGNPQDELGRLAETFNQLFARVDSALRQLRQFVTDASHELRTPLSVLQGETELVLSQPRGVEEYRKTLQVIDEELRKLTRIVEGLFTLSMADAGQLRLAKEPLYLNEVLEEACALATPRAELKRIAILRDLKQDVAYRGDETFLRQLFLVFLDNAVKYSPPKSSIRVALSAEGGLVRVRFEDQGIGIASADLPRIFERFYRAAPPSNGEAQSGGLGLAIAQAIVRAHDGSIDCESVSGCGSTFTVKLPWSASQGALSADSAGVEAQAARRG